MHVAITFRHPEENPDGRQTGRGQVVYPPKNLGRAAKSCNPYPCRFPMPSGQLPTGWEGALPQGSAWQAPRRSVARAVAARRSSPGAPGFPRSTSTLGVGVNDHGQFHQRPLGGGCMASLPVRALPHRARDSTRARVWPRAEFLPGRDVGVGRRHPPVVLEGRHPHRVAAVLRVEPGVRVVASPLTRFCFAGVLTVLSVLCR